MCRDLDRRIDEVRLIYRVIGTLVTGCEDLSKLLVKANGRTETALTVACGADDTGVPKLAAIRKYFEGLNKDYKRLLDKQIKRFTEKEGDEEYEDKIRDYKENAEKPSLRFLMNCATGAAAEGEDCGAAAEDWDEDIELACILTLFKHGYSQKPTGAFYQSFLEIKYKGEDSQFIKELVKTRNYVKTTFKEQTSRSNNRKKIKYAIADDRHGWDLYRDCVVGFWCTNNCSWFCSSSDAVDAVDDVKMPLTGTADVEMALTADEKKCDRVFVSCRTAVKCRIIFLTSMILATEIAYAVMLYLNSMDHLANSWLVIPLGAMVFLIQALFLIPCYTDSDSEKAKKIMQKFIDSIYSDIVCSTARKISGLADQEGFMIELETIRKGSDKAIESVKAFDVVIDKAFHFLIALISSLQKKEDKSGPCVNPDHKSILFYEIEPRVNPNNGSLTLQRRIHRDCEGYTENLPEFAVNVTWEDCQNGKNLLDLPDIDDEASALSETDGASATHQKPVQPGQQAVGDSDASQQLAENEAAVTQLKAEHEAAVTQLEVAAAADKERIEHLEVELASGINSQCNPSTAQIRRP